MAMAKTKKKKSRTILHKIKKKAKIVHKHGKKIAKKAPSHRKTIAKHGKKRLQSGISIAKKITSFSSPKESLHMLEKLGDLRKKKIISEKEFQAMKKDIIEKF